MHPRALRAVGRADCASISAAGLEALVRRLGLTDVAAATLRRLEPQAPRDRRAFSNRLIAPHESAARRSAIPCRAADRLRPGSGLSGRQSRHGRRAARQWLRRRHAARAALLRIAARAQRRAGAGARAGAADDRPVPARPLRRDHQQRRRLRIASAPLRSPARGRSALPRAWRSSGTAKCGTFRSGWWRSVAARRRHRRSTQHDDGDVPRVVSPCARAESLSASRARSCGFCPACRSSNCRSPPGAAAAPASTRSPSRLRPTRFCEEGRTSAAPARAVVATANPGCHLQIARGLGDAGLAMQVVHPVSLLARAYRREGSAPNSVHGAKS